MHVVAAVAPTLPRQTKGHTMPCPAVARICDRAIGRAGSSTRCLSLEIAEEQHAAARPNTARIARSSNIPGYVVRPRDRIAKSLRAGSTISSCCQILLCVVVLLRPLAKRLGHIALIELERVWSRVAASAARPTAVDQA